MKPHASNIIPFKIIRYHPNFQSQVLMTTRKEKKVRIRYSEYFKSKAPTPILSPPSPDLNSLRESLPSTPSLDNNINRLKKLDSRPASRAVISHTPKSPFNRKLLRQHSSIKAFMVIDIEDEIVERPNSKLSIRSNASTFNSRKQPLLISRVFWRQLNCIGTLPHSRESGTMVTIGPYLYLFGGLSRVKLHELQRFNIPKLEWRPFTTFNNPPGRLGHSCVRHKYSLLVFGGSSNSRKNGFRRCSRKIYRLLIQEERWEEVKSIGELVNGRRNHAACQMGRTMIVYGGVDSQARIREELFIFDIPTQVWKIPNLEGKISPGFRSHSTLTLVCADELKEEFELNLDMMWEYHSTHSHTTGNFGFYLFGGLDLTWNPTNAFHMLQVIDSKFYWNEIQAAGTPPSPRFGHTAVSIGVKIYIFGGRNDEFFKEQKESCLNDLHVFDCEGLLWHHVELFGTAPEGRWGHCMSVHNSSLLLFGGISHTQYKPPDLFSLETDRFKVEEVLKALDNN